MKAYGHLSFVFILIKILCTYNSVYAQRKNTDFRQAPNMDGEGRNNLDHRKQSKDPSDLSTRRTSSESNSDESSPSALLLPGSRCSCQSCDDVAWSTVASGYTCGERISFLQLVDSKLYPSEKDACVRVAEIEYPSQCGACDPSRCDGRTPPVTTESSYCGCQECTEQIWKSLVDDVSCEAHITWVQNYVPEKTSEPSACQYVSEMFPLSACGQYCNPATCQQLSLFAEVATTESKITCGCPNCSDEILARVADVFTCAERIRFLTGSTSETEACSVVAGKEFPDICGPQCDPARCNSAPVSPLPVAPVTAPTVTFVASPMLAPTNSQPPAVAQSPTTNQAPFSDPFISPDIFLGNGDFGSNVIIFNPTMSTASIQETFDRIYNQQVNNEMGKERYSLLFLPGTYGTIEQPLSLLIGYYMEVAGLGASPLDVVINGKIEVYNRCFEPDPYNAGKFIPTSAENGGLCFALNNFWRTLSNLSINIVHRVGLDSCRQTAMFWAISQASSMRRVEIRGGDLSLMDYCTNPGFSSGGFISDSRHTGTKIINGSQQQFCARNMEITEWKDGVWNQVFLGVVGAPDDSTYPDPPFTTLDTNPLSREKPYLFSENGNYFVRVPSAKANSRGITWSAGLTDGITVPLSKFFIVKPSDSVTRINAALINGTHLIFSPGVYRIPRSIIVRRANTIVLGLGHATLVAVRGAIPLVLRDRPGIIVSGVTIDAGSVESPVLLKVGDVANSTIKSTSALNPITLHDIYFRVGGPYIGKANICLEINSNHVLVDHTWIWRADHGIENFTSSDGFDGDNIRWKTNIGRNGLVVNGNDVTITGLFVEHYQEYNVLWNGQRGRVFFFQNELPYDPPTQDDWKADDGTLGWAGYKVTSKVTNHQLIGGGVYCYNRNNPDIVTQNGFETPSNVPGIKVSRVYTRNLSGPGKVFSVLNGIGGTVDSLNKGPNYVVN